jgi:hypothetical protein
MHKLGCVFTSLLAVFPFSGQQIVKTANNKERLYLYFNGMGICGLYKGGKNFPKWVGQKLTLYLKNIRKVTIFL